ncbi:hypothetical protein SAMN05444422_11334 [Halobiforma haloterrestris]|uniref:Uncharacterized protein n=1 Tax=Natronobacterium haloterrestre TaxID=148448 RepID=A0A1I1KWM5_NATHA|nr:hypothetical protein [Halobiforma haloterrestris]SFC65035.1 hypothetical protein SAMN05444422_11334 [Halobiforma haloterrestris]
MADSIDLETNTTPRHGVTFVSVTVTNGRATPQRVRLETRFDAPVWTPSAGRGAAVEWTNGAWRGVVDPGRTRGLGFATPADPRPEPVQVTAATRVSGPDGLSSPDVILDSLESGSPAGVPPSTSIDG